MTFRTMILRLTIMLVGGTAGAAPLRPFPQHVDYAPGTIRPTSVNQTQQDADVRAFYDHWSQSYLVEAGSSGGHPLYRVTFGSGNPNRTVSEGQGYGMIIVALMAGHDPQAQTRFDGLWDFSRAHPSSIDSRLMGWQVPGPIDNDSAFDGDADIAYGLLLADAQWGSAGRIDYRAAALDVMAGILESTIGPESHLPMLGDWIDADGATYNQYTPRSSDFMPGHFRAYARASGNAVWLQVLARSQDVVTSLQSGFSPATGLLPDFIVPTSPSNHAPRPAPPNFLESSTDDDYSYNAGRDPWRLGTDALLSGDAISKAQAQRISQWAETAAVGNAGAIRAGYKLDGTPLSGSDYFTTFFAAPLGVAAMTVPTQQEWLNKVYTSVRMTHEDYYEDSVTMLCLLVMTGNFWDPTTSTVVGTGPLEFAAFLALAFLALARMAVRQESASQSRGLPFRCRGSSVATQSFEIRSASRIPVR